MEFAPRRSWWQQSVMFLELIRFSHTIFALPFALLATLLALRVPLPDGTQVPFRYRDLCGILLCMFTARSAAMAFNRIVDRNMDGANPRTQSRHLPAGKMSLGSVVLFCFICSAGFIASTLLFLPNWLPIVLAFPVLLWLLGYSYAKRFTSAAHLWLGIALALSPVCAWIALRGTAVLEHPNDLFTPLTLSLAIAFWVAGFDIIYACQDYQFDRQQGLFSVPAKLGVRGALRLAALFHALMLVPLIAFPFVNEHLGLGWLYAVTLAIITGLLLYEHMIVKPDDLQRVGIAFFQINAAISLILMSSAAIDHWWG